MLFRFLIISALFGGHSNLADHSDEQEWLIAASNKMNRTNERRFYNYACGNWKTFTNKTLNPYLFHYDNPEYMEEQSALFLYQEMTNLNESLLQYKFEKDTVRLYKSCVKWNNHTRNLDNMQNYPFNRIIKSTLWRLQIDEILKDNLTGARHILYELIRNGSWSFTNILTDTRRAVPLIHLFFRLNVFRYEKDRARSVMVIRPPGHNLMYYDYYKNQTILRIYKSFVGGIMNNVGLSDPDIENLVILDEKLARARHVVSLLSGYDEERVCNSSYLDVTYTWLNWTEHFTGMFAEMNLTYPQSSLIEIESVRYMEEITKIIEKYLSTTRGKLILNDFMLYMLLKDFKGVLPKRFRNGHSDVNKYYDFDYRAKDPWLHCLLSVNEYLPNTMQYMYAKLKSLTDQTKNEIGEIFSNLKHNFQKSLHNIDWLDQKYKDLIFEKVNSTKLIIGTPEYYTLPTTFENISLGVHIDDNDFIKSFLSALSIKNRNNFETLIYGFETKINYEKPNFEANGLNIRDSNTIYITLASLQAPMYEPGYPWAVKYGAIGYSLGHEIMHSLDATGLKYDKDGVKRDWLPQNVVELIKKRWTCYIDQYHNYKIRDNLWVNPFQTLGENLPDNDGVQLAYKAYKSVSKDNLTYELPNGEVLSGDKIFFLAFAQSWCGMFSDEVLTQYQKLKVHAANKFRILGALRNSKEFHQTFNTTKYCTKPKRCSMWIN